MKKNVGNLDRAIRLTLVLVIAILVFTEIVSGGLSVSLQAIGAVLLLTSFIRFCPLYLPFGLSSRKKG